MKLLHKIVLLLALFTFSSVSVQAMDLICNFSEYNEKVPDKKVHDIRIHIFYDDDKTNIGYVYLGKNKKVDSVIDYNWDYLLFKIKYHYDYGKTDVTYKIDRVTNEIKTYRSEVVNGNRSYTVYYKGVGTCQPYRGPSKEHL